MKFYLLFVAVFGVATAELAKFTQCEESSSEVCEVTEVQITPCGKSSCTLKKGHESSIEFDFIPKFAADKLTTGLYWASPNGDVSFDDFSNVDACQYTACPTLAGQKQTLTYSLRLSKKLPNGKFTFKWKLWNADDDTKMCCFKTEVNLKKG